MRGRMNINSRDLGSEQVHVQFIYISFKTKLIFLLKCGFIYKKMKNIKDN